jgi:hypothetical protein
MPLRCIKVNDNQSSWQIGTSTCRYPTWCICWRKYWRLKTYLILDQELDTFDGSGSGLGDCGRDTTHCYHELVVDTYRLIAQKPSSIHVYDSDNGHGAAAEEDILKKSITKGGLLRNWSA